MDTVQTPIRDFIQIPIKVTSGILLHIGAGIYNSVAGAIKELVSNAYDADATQVVITTDHPNFNEIIIVDNGSGMTYERFQQAMQHIGSSLKGVLEPNRLTPTYKRPIIGHLGIGLMSLSQICDKAIIESQIWGAEEKFIAELDFTEFKRNKEQQTEAARLDVLRSAPRQYGGIDAIQEKLKELTPNSEEYLELVRTLELAEAAEKRFKESALEDPEEEHLGYAVVYPGIPAIPGEHGTIIRLEQIDEGVKASLKDAGRSKDAMPQNYRGREDADWAVYRKEVDEWSWEELCERLQYKTGGLAYEALPQYHQFLWELAVMTPVKYFANSPVAFDETLLENKKQQLDGYNFSITVDNRNLLKPILLPSGSWVRNEELEPRYDYNLELFYFDNQVDGTQLTYSGYLFWQRRQIIPSSLRGVQIYIRNVGIGLYDQTLMGFSNVNPTSRAGQISGEIYVEAGLERALNVDRNSFRETDAHYTALQEHLWDLLGSTTRGDGLMGKSVDAYWKRKEIQNTQTQQEHFQQLRQWVLKASDGQMKLEISEDANEMPYEIEPQQIVLYDNSLRWPRANARKQLSQQLIIPVQAAIANGASPTEILSLLEEILLS